MRLPPAFALIIALSWALPNADVLAVEAVTSQSRQLDLYYTLQQRIAQPGEISDEGLAGLKLLLAQLYTEMGMLLAAEQTLDALQGGPSVEQLRDMGRLLLARQLRMRGEYAAASEQLGRIDSTLDSMLERERQQMLALSALERGFSDEALRRYGRIQAEQGPVLLARFNYATMLLRQGQVEHSLILLQEIADYPVASVAVSALRDRASLLLGYHFLKQQQYQDARSFLSRVRLDGPYSRPALLAMGWVELQLSGPEEAVVPWMELLAYNKGDSLDEEAELAIAAAISSKGASVRVVEHYNSLLAKFEGERAYIASVLQRHAEAYDPQQIQTVLDENDDALARNSIAGIEFANLLDIRRFLRSGQRNSIPVALDEGAFFERLWPQLAALYPEPDDASGAGVSAHVARYIERFTRNSLQTSSRSLRPATDVAARIESDWSTLDGEIAVVAEWFRRSYIAALQARDERLKAYMERARLAIARSHDQALRRQERE